MKYWQKSRNYRKYHNPNGTCRCVITVDGEEVEVTPEVYQAYAQADRRERYCYEREKGLLLLLDQMDVDNMHLAFLTEQHTESAENTAIRNILMESAQGILSRLESDEQAMIRAIVMNGETEQAYADRIGLSQKGLNKRKQKILKKIFQMLVLNSPGFRDGQ